MVFHSWDSFYRGSCSALAIEHLEVNWVYKEEVDNIVWELVINQAKAPVKIKICSHVAPQEQTTHAKKKKTMRALNHKPRKVVNEANISSFFFDKL